MRVVTPGALLTKFRTAIQNLRAQPNNATAPNFHGSLDYLLLCDCFARRDINMILSAEHPIEETWEKPPMSDKDFWPLTKTMQQSDCGTIRKAGMSEQTEPSAASVTRPRQSTGYLPAVPPPAVGLALDWSDRFAGVARGRTKVPRYVLSALRPKLSAMRPKWSEIRRRIEAWRPPSFTFCHKMTDQRQKEVNAIVFHVRPPGPPVLACWSSTVLVTGADQ